MNIYEMDILKLLYKESFENQRIVSEKLRYSLGVVNKALKSLIASGYLDDNMNLTTDGKKTVLNNSPKRAIILAAGFGMRMVPINTMTPKALLEIHGEPLIERLIKQLNEVGIKEIYIVVGFLKEQFEYLIDEYSVQLIVNELYASKNNLHSLFLTSDKLFNTYVIPCDIWCRENPFSENELYSWYMVTDKTGKESNIRVNRKMELVLTSEESEGNTMIGISYLTEKDALVVKERLEEYNHNKKYDNSFWEVTLYEKEKMIIPAKVVNSDNYIEINTYEQLRELDQNSNHLKSDTISLIGDILNVNETSIKNISVLKKGMTNRSFLFDCNNKKYIMRIPGEGTDNLINRKNEASVYNKIKDRNICDEIIYINPDNGYKISSFLENSRVCDSKNEEDLKKCMNKLKSFHELRLKVEHDFDIFHQIIFYEKLWDNNPSIYKDYIKVKENVFKLKDYIDKQEKEYCLTHIDAVPDNFLFTHNGEIKIIDWEYAGMQDPHVDIAMFCIYALYNRTEIDRLIDLYFNGQCRREVRIKIYCYIAACGLLWSNWCEYKRSFGIEFGEYSLRQYRYAKEYYKIVIEEMEEIKCTQSKEQ